jgi:hypothetical protein
MMSRLAHGALGSVTTYLASLQMKGGAMRSRNDRIWTRARELAEAIGPGCVRSLAEASRHEVVSWYRQTRRHGAYHEAGHALAAVVLGVFDVKSLRADPCCGDIGRVSFYRDVPESYSKGGRDYWRDRAVVSVAGPCAESQVAKYDQHDFRGYGQPDVLWTFAHERGTGANDFVEAYEELLTARDIQDERFFVEEDCEKRLLSPSRKPRPAEWRTWLRALELLKREARALEALARRLLRRRAPLNGDEVNRIVAAQRSEDGRRTPPGAGTVHP